MGENGMVDYKQLVAKLNWRENPVEAVQYQQLPIKVRNASAFDGIVICSSHSRYTVSRSHADVFNTTPLNLGVRIAGFVFCKAQGSSKFERAVGVRLWSYADVLKQQLVLFRQNTWTSHMLRPHAVGLVAGKFESDKRCGKLSDGNLSWRLC